MLFRVMRTLLAVPLLVLSLMSPAFAQEVSAKQAWQTFRAFAQGAGFIINSTGSVDQGSALVLSNVRVRPEDNSDTILIEIPELRVEARGTQLALIPSPQFTVVLHPRPGTERRFQVSHDGEAVVEVSDTSVAVDMAFGQFALALLDATSRGARDDMAFDLALSGFSTLFRATIAGDIEINLGADTASYSYRLSNGMNSQEATAEIALPVLSFSGTSLALLGDETPGMLRRAFDGGLGARLEFSTGASASTSSQTFASAPFTMTSNSAGAELIADLSNGVFSMQSSTGASRIAGGMGQMLGDVAFDGISLSLSLPVLATPEDAAFNYSMAVNNLIATPETLAFVNAQDFAGDAVSLTLDVGATGRWLVDLGPEFGESDDVPIDLSQVSLNTLALRVGSAELTGSGAVALLLPLAQQLNLERPELNGDMVFDLIGGDALLTRLSTAGLIPNDQQFLARMMMNGLGRPIGADHLRSEVTFRAGGQILVNGAPLPF